MTSVRRPPYWLTLLLALDRVGAAVFFNRADLTISTLCWMALLVKDPRRPSWSYADGTNLDHAALDPGEQDTLIACRMVVQVNPYRWQFWALVGIGHALEFLSPRHCARARKDDLVMLDATRALLTGKNT